MAHRDDTVTLTLGAIPEERGMEQVGQTRSVALADRLRAVGDEPLAKEDIMQFGTN